MRWQRKDLLGIQDLTAEELETLLAASEPFHDVFTRPIKKYPTLRGKVVVNLFYEPSTRTRTSFEMAAKWLSADVVNIATSASSVVKGESLKDTVLTLEALGADIVVVRHSASGAPYFIARHTRAAVVNAGDGAHEHPTQALLDVATARRFRGSIRDKHLVIVGDILHSRVARSVIYAFTRLGARVTLVGPPTLLPHPSAVAPARLASSLDQVLAEADILYMLRIQKERQAGGNFPSLREYRHLFGLTRDRLGRLKEDALIMHPGPTNFGVEMDAEALQDPRCVIRDQVRTGVAIRMAVLYLLAGGAGYENLA